VSAVRNGVKQLGAAPITVVYYLVNSMDELKNAFFCIAAVNDER
jgi:hypothetical protein